jgi:hypothetical protein
LKTINDVIQDYFKKWNEAFVTKNPDGIRGHMSTDFVGYWAHSGINEPDPYYYNYDLKSVLEQMDNAEKSFEVASIAERKNGEEMLVLGRETNVINGEPYTAQCMFVWKNEDSGWKLLREYIELER